MIASAPTATHGGCVEHVEVTRARVRVIDHGEQPALVVAAPVVGSDEDRLAGPAPRTRVPGRDLAPVQVELQEALGGSGRFPPARSAPRPRVHWAVAPAHLDAVPIPEGGALAQGIHAWILHVALVDLYPFQPIALDPPPFQQAEAPTDGRQTDPLGADHRCREVDRLAGLGSLVTTDVQLDDAVLAAPADLPRPKHMGHQAGVESDPPHPRPVAAAPHDADPALRTWHPTEGHRAPRGVGETGRRRLDEDDMISRHGNVVLPRGPFERHRLGTAQTAAGFPFPEAEPDAVRLVQAHRRIRAGTVARASRAIPSTVDPVVDGEQHATAVGRHSVHVRGDGHRQAAGEPLGLQEP